MADVTDKRDNPDDRGEIDGDDPTLDIVRQMIVEAEALPEPEPEPEPEPVPEPARPAVFARFAEEDDLGLWDDEAEAPGWDEVYAGEAEPDDLAGDDPVPAAPRDSRLKRWIRALLAWAWAHVLRFLRRPDAPRRIALVLLVLSVFVWPWEVFKVSFLVPLAVLITWASVGNQGVRELVVLWHGKLSARDPVKAERIRLAAAATSRALTGMVERLPGEWKRGFRLPDFEPEDHVPEKMKVDPFEGLAARVHAAKHGDGRR